jgi:hypothetical protein
MGWVCSAYEGEERGAYRVLVWKHGGKNHLEEPGVGGRLI